MGGGGGGHFGGGYSGGGHFGGGHVMGSPGGGHYAGVAGGYFNYGGGHYVAPHFAGAAPHFGGAAPRIAGGGAPTAVHAPVHGGFPTMSANHSAGHFSGGGFVPGSGGWNGWRGWGGGYWHGTFWPHVWFNPGFAWFLPVLPYGCTTFWWGGSPYYYWNNLYYTWSPTDYGYVVTDPPPVAGSNASDSSSGYGDGGSGADVYLYPRNGQSDAQTQQDRYECHSWAVSQTGFDPTRSSQQSSGSAADYRRAMIACLDARGYSAR
jgi:hypothetical protein